MLAQSKFCRGGEKKFDMTFSKKKKILIELYLCRRNDVPRLFVKNVPLGMNDVVFRELFETCGTVDQAYLYSKSNTSYKIGKISFTSMESVHKAVSKFNKQPPYNMVVELDRFDRNKRPQNVSSTSCSSQIGFEQRSFPSTAQRNGDTFKHNSGPELSPIQSLYECVVCSKQTHSKCSNCSTFYCSTECQTADWNNHQFLCSASKNFSTGVRTTPNPVQKVGTRSELHNNTERKYGQRAERSGCQSGREMLSTSESLQNKNINSSLSRSCSTTSSQIGTNTKNHMTACARPLFQKQDNAKILEPKNDNVSSVLDNFVMTPVSVSTPMKSVHQNCTTSIGSSSEKKPFPDKPTKVTVTFIVDPHNFYVRSFGEDVITPLIQDIPPNKIPPPVKVNDILAAKFREDNVWYRAKILNINKDGSCTVYFIDYGNVGQVIMSEILTLPDDLARLPGQAFNCRLANVEPKDGVKWTVEETDVFENFIEKNVLVAKRVKFINEVNWIILTDDGCVDIATLYEDLRSSSPQSTATVPLPINSSTLRNWNCNDRITVVILLNDEPGNLWVLDDSESVLDKLSYLNEECSSSRSNLSEFSVGSIVAARESSGDKLWYRAVVLEVHKNGWYVQYLDFGNCDAVTEVRPLSDKYQKFSAAAVKLIALSYPDKLDDKFLTNDNLQLKVIEKGSNMAGVTFTDDSEHLYCAVSVWHEIKRRLTKALTSKLLVDDFKVKSTNHSTTVKNAICEAPAVMATPALETVISPEEMKSSRDVKKVMVNLRERLEAPRSSLAEVGTLNIPYIKFPDLNGKVPVAVIICNVGEIYLQIITSETEELMNTLLKYLDECEHEKQLNERPSVSELLCAKSCEYVTWYRCEVLRVNSRDSIEVRYIDYGNTETVDLESLVKMPKEIRDVPKLAFPVVLADVELTDEMCEFIQQEIDWQMSVIDAKNTPVKVVLSKKDGTLLKDIIKNLSVEVEDCFNVQSEPQKQLTQEQQTSPNRVTTNVSPTAAAETVVVTDNSISEQPSSNKKFTTDIPSTSNSSTETLASNDKSGIKSDDGELKEFLYDDATFVEMPVGETVKATFTEASSPLQMFCWYGDFEEIAQKLIELSDTISTFMDETKCFYLPKKGEMCVAKYAKDDLWYRATCINSEQDSYQLLFVDYGNVETVSSNCIGKMQNEFFNIPIQGLFCGLNGIPDDVLLGPDKCEQFKELVPCGETFDIKVIEFVESYYLVEIPSIKESLKKLELL
ncbi:hypothetical protein CHUAL_008232 [Chamberlinius hualienensis]